MPAAVKSRLQKDIHPPGSLGKSHGPAAENGNVRIVMLPSQSRSLITVQNYRTNTPAAIGSN